MNEGLVGRRDGWLKGWVGWCEDIAEEAPYWIQVEGFGWRVQGSMGLVGFKTGWLKAWLRGFTRRGQEDAGRGRGVGGKPHVGSLSHTSNAKVSSTSSFSMLSARASSSATSASNSEKASFAITAPARHCPHGRDNPPALGRR